MERGRLKGGKSWKLVIRGCSRKIEVDRRVEGWTKREIDQREEEEEDGDFRPRSSILLCRDGQTRDDELRYTEESKI